MLIALLLRPSLPEVEDPQRVVAADAIARCRAGKGPAFIEFVTRRWEGSKPMWPELSTGITDVTMAWDASRIPKRHRDWFIKEDPILIFIRRLLKEHSATREQVAALDKRVMARNKAAGDRAIKSPMPRGETALSGVFA